MKYFAIFLVLIPISAFALSLDFGSDNSRSIEDLMYVPGKGKLIFEINGRHADKSKEKGNQNSEIESNFGNLKLSYGILEDVALIIEGDYYLDDTKTTSSGTSETEEVAAGLTNPKIGIKHRFLRQGQKIDEKLRIDLTLHGSPGIGDSEEGTTSKDGNKFSGGQSYGIELEAGKKYKEFSFAVSFTYDHYTRSEKTLLSNNSLSKTDAYSDLGIFVITKFDLTNRLSANLGWGLVSRGDIETSNGTTQVKHTGGYGSRAKFGISYILKKDSVLFKAGLEKNKIARSVGRKIFLEDVNTVELGLRFLL